MMQRSHLSRLHSARTNVQSRGHALHIVSFDEPEDNNVPLLTVQPGDRFAEHVAQAVAGIRAGASLLLAERTVGNVE